MYHHLRGKVVELNPTTLVLEVGGVGYDIRIPVSTYDSLKGAQEAAVFTHLHVREDDLRLFGFATVAERELFRLLVSVSGVGPSTAIAALCSLPPRDVGIAIASGDLKTLQRIKGVGRKTAERLTVELRDRMGTLLLLLGADGSEASGARAVPVGRPRPAEALDAIDALIAIGYERKAAEERVDAVLKKVEGSEGGGRPSVERIFKEALKGT